MERVEQQTEPQKKKRFEVNGGGGALITTLNLSACICEPPVLSPARSTAKARARRRNIILASTILAIVLLAIGYAWVTNPSFNVPSNAVARVNGEFIYDHDVQRQGLPDFPGRPRQDPRDISAQRCFGPGRHYYSQDEV